VDICKEQSDILHQCSLAVKKHRYRRIRKTTAKSGC